MDKDIIGYEGLYTISSNGDIRSIRRNIVLRHDTSSGYARVILQRNGKTGRFLVHRLVAMSFVDGYFDGAIVNHIDGDTLNNNCNNLEWCNQSHNQLHAVHTTKTKENAKKSMQKNNKTGYIGVMKQNDVYCVQIRHKKKTIYTKYGFKNALDAARHRDKYLNENNLPHKRSL